MWVSINHSSVENGDVQVFDFFILAQSFPPLHLMTQIRDSSVSHLRLSLTLSSTFGLSTRTVKQRKQQDQEKMHRNRTSASPVSLFFARLFALFRRSCPNAPARSTAFLDTAALIFGWQ